MAMHAGGRGGRVASAMNVTPLIDVLLVLLIVFMVAERELRRGLALQLPPPAGEAPPPPGPDRIVLEVEPGGRYRLNTAPVPAERLEARLAEVYAGRPRTVIFVKGARDLTYGELMRAVDASRAAGVRTVGLVPVPAGAPARRGGAS
jgi:biopolymer transport protein TolR